MPVKRENDSGSIRSRRLRDRFAPEAVNEMVEQYREGVTARTVAERFEVSLSTVKRLMKERGVTRAVGSVDR